MTTVLPSLVINPFSSRFEVNSSESSTSTDVGNPSNKIVINHTRQPCGIATLSGSTPATTQFRNNENSTPAAEDLFRASPLARLSPETSKSWRSAATDIPARKRKLIGAQSPTQAVRSKHDTTLITKSGTSQEQQNISTNLQCPVQSILASIAPKCASTTTHDYGVGDGGSEVVCEDSSTEPFPSLPVTDPCTPKAQVKLMPRSSANRPTHFHRVSEASSAFVHTIKTASFSNRSFSILPCSSRLGDSSETQSTYFACRNSFDSEIPMTSSSNDEVAAARGIKRRHILDELRTTEQSYIADLKALIYLYSTLLATTSAISNTVRAAMQKNVANLLNLHEGMLDNLQQATFRGAARKWVSTSSPTRSNRPTDGRNHSDGLPYGMTLTRTRRHVSRANNLVNQTQVPVILGSADAADVLEVAVIFQDALSSLRLYEEYCANHEVISYELQKQKPVLWSTYEAGMESLSRALSAINQKDQQARKGVTVGDLLIKPIQRICRYPLILQDLLCHTPVVDGPGAHEALDSVLGQFQDQLRAINIATADQLSRSQVRRRWFLHDRLNLSDIVFSPEQFRNLGHIHLCGVLYVTYQSIMAVNGCYALCVLFESHFLIALPEKTSSKFNLLALMRLRDMNVESSHDGKGLQSPSAFHTFKIDFVVDGSLYEVLLSACSTEEADQWLSGFDGTFRSKDICDTSHISPQTQIFLDLRTTGRIFTPDVPLSHQTSVQRAATVGNRAAMCHVVLRNTYNQQGLHNFRSTSAVQVNRSRSNSSPKRLVVLAPKRSERTKLEISLSDVWTKDKLPFPGMTASKGSQIFRASAGSLVRKLSFASIQAPFSRRSASITVSSKKSFDVFSERSHTPSAFRIKRNGLHAAGRVRTNRPNEVPELDTMDSVIGRMIGSGHSGPKRMSFSEPDKALQKGTKNRFRASSHQPAPEDPASVFYNDDDNVKNAGTKTFAETSAQSGQNSCSDAGEMSKNTSVRRKRWSNPISKLKGLVLKS